MDYDPIDPRSPTSETRILFPQKKKKERKKEKVLVGSETNCHRGPTPPPIVPTRYLFKNP